MKNSANYLTPKSAELHKDENPKKEHLIQIHKRRSNTMTFLTGHYTQGLPHTRI